VVARQFLQCVADALRERNKSTNDGFETMGKETALRGENVKYISSSPVFCAPLVIGLYTDFTQGEEPKPRETHPNG